MKKQSVSKCPEQKRELKETNQLVELCSKVVYNAVVKIGVPDTMKIFKAILAIIFSVSSYRFCCFPFHKGIILPKAVVSFYVYYTTDSQNNAFELSILS